jgi:hypothetical protein
MKRLDVAGIQIGCEHLAFVAHDGSHTATVVVHVIFVLM